MNKSRVRETLCFAGVFLVVHFATSLVFEHVQVLDAAHASSRSESAADLFVRSAIASALATPMYLVLMFWYRRFDAKRERSVTRDER